MAQKRVGPWEGRGKSAEKIQKRPYKRDERKSQPARRKCSAWNGGMAQKRVGPDEGGGKRAEKREKREHGRQQDAKVQSRKGGMA